MCSSYRVERVDAGRWRDLATLFGRSGASNGCWCQYWLLGPQYRRRDRDLNRRALQHEPTPGLVAYASDEAPVGWARLSPRSRLTWLDTRFDLPPGSGIWSMPCFYVAGRMRGAGVMTALLAAGVEAGRDAGVTIEGYPVDPAVPGATRNRFTGVLPAFLAAGFREVGRLARDRVVVRRPL